MKQLTIKNLVAWKPCYHPAKYLDKNWTGTVIDLLNTQEIPIKDRVWCGLKCLPIIQKQYFAIWCARQALAIPEIKIDKRSIKALEVAELYLDGGASIEELKKARVDAADAAAYAAYADAAAYAAAAAAARDKILSDFAEDVVQILIDMKVPGVQWLPLTEAA